MFRKSLLCASLLFVGCGQMDETEFREGVPSKEMVEMKSPGPSKGQRLESGSANATAQGQLSVYYELTHDTTETVNAGTEAVLTLIDKITQHTPTSIEGDVAVWGPHTEALARNTWKLTVTKTGENSYSYKLEGKAKTAADSEFKVILSGSHTIATDEQGNRLRNFGSGTFKLDWDAAQTLPDHGKETGTAEITYSRPSAQVKATVEAAFRNVQDDKQPEVRVDADYQYEQTPGAGGEFSFVLDKNIDEDPARSAIEHLTVKSRWTQSGSGRADVKISGGDFLLATATLSECWDANFNSQYLVMSWPPGFGYGNVSACGSFSAAVYVNP